jgi:L,D-peptidoglycan transpeptidase YkuD (ErfK/YbiS/YcfS/YnhG family)
MELLVRSNDAYGAQLECGGERLRAAIGLSGIGVKRAEGDGLTPVGVFPLRNVLFRADRVARPLTGLPLRQLAADDGWCDAPGDPAYNQPVKVPCRISVESLWRDDMLYDLVVVIGFNDAPVVPGLGSAIFLHVAREDYGPTQGCVALAKDDLVRVVAQLKPGDTIAIRA